MGMREKSNWWFTAAVLAVLIAGGLFTLKTVRQTDRHMRNQLLVQAASIAGRINIDHVRALTFTQADTSNVHFQILRSQMIDYGQALRALFGGRIRHLSIYSMIRRDGEILFGPENIDASDPRASPPGTPYKKPPSELRALLQSGAPGTAGPYTDEYGTFISAFAPALDPVTNEPALMVGMDMDAADWQAIIFYSAIPHVLFTVLLLAIISLGHFLIYRRHRIPVESRGWLLRYADVLIAAAVGLAVTAVASYLAHDAEKRKHNDAFIQLALTEPADIARLLHEISESALEGLVRFFESSQFVDRHEFHTFTGYLIKNPVVQTWAWIPAVTGGELDGFVKDFRREYGEGFSVWEKGPGGMRVPEAVHDLYYPVTYLEPFNNNRDILGYNLGSDRHCRAAMDCASQTGMSMGTDPVAQAPGQNGRPEIFVFKPLSVSAPHSNRTCFVAAVLNIEKLLAKGYPLKSPYNKSTVIVDLYRPRTGALPLLLASFPPSQSSRKSSGALLPPPADKPLFIGPVFAYGKAYAVGVRPGPMFFSLYPVRAALQTGAACLTITALVALFIFILSRRSALLEQQVLLRTRELSESNSALQETAQRLEHILSVSKTRIDIIDARFNLRYVDTEWQKVYGDPAGRKCYEYFMGRDTPCPTCGIPEALRTKQIVTTEETLPREGGRVVKVQTIPFEDPGGEWLVAEFNVDITELKNAEEELRTSKEFLENVFRTSGDGLVVTDKQGVILTINHRALEMLGYGKDELTGRNMSVMLPETRDGGASAMHPVFGRLFSRGFISDYESEYRRKDGTLFWAEANIIAMKDAAGNVIGAVGSIRDVTERKKTEKKLKESRDFLKTVIESSRDGIIICDPGGVIVLVNKAIEDMFGFSNAELLGAHASSLVTDDPAVRKQVLDATADLFQKGYATYETVHKAKDGATIVVECISSLIKDENGENIAGVSILRDITGRKRLEHQLRHSQKMEAIGTLAGGIAHDFNNILAAILGYAELSLCSAPDGTPLRHNLEQIVLSSARARDLVRQILAFSRKDIEEKKPVLISSVIKESLKLLRATIPATIEIRESIHDDAAAVPANQTQMHQLLMNLCTNAAQAMSESGGVLEVGMKTSLLQGADLAEHPELAAGAYVLLTVSDTGEGIDPKHIDRIFEPFFTTKEFGKGTGMGLAVAHGIIKSHGGDIKVKSEKGRGSIFQVLLPMTNEHPQESALQTKPPATGHERILFVDDDPALVSIGESQLRALGYSVTATQSSREALDLFERNPAAFDIVITDQTMPHITGDALAKKMLARRPDLPILVCTGFSEKLSEETAREIGIKALLMKPVNRREMAETIRKIMDG